MVPVPRPEQAEVVAAPRAGDRRRSAAHVEADHPDVDLPDAVPSDAPRFRRSSIRARVLGVAALGILVAVLLTVVLVWSLARTAAFADEIAELSGLRSSNQAVTVELGAAVEDPAAVPGILRDAEAVDDQLDRAAEGTAAEPAVTAAVAATERFLVELESGAAEVGSDEFEQMTGTRDEVDRALGDRQDQLADSLNTTRVLAVGIALLLMLGGGALLVVLALAVTRSLDRPLRELARAMRRFGDGSLAARAQPAADQVGTLARSFNHMADGIEAQLLRLSGDAESASQLRLITDALDLADTEADVHRITAQAIGILSPGRPAELLATGDSTSQLRAVSVHPTAGPAGCPVGSTAECVAMRRGQPMVFDDPTAINACPLLARHEAPCSAACVPVNVNGYFLGVMHVTDEVGRPPTSPVVDQLVTLGGHVGARISAIRTLESTRLEAQTDGLTGLANRRTLEARVGELLRARTPFVLVVADLDHFHQLNHTYGHEVGDQALQQFARVLQANVRGHDLVARFGGEEFVLVYPEMSVQPSLEIIERIRQALDVAIMSAGLPRFTCSFGVTHSSVGDSVASIVRVADAGLYTAKDLGRNQVVYADEALAAEVFSQARPSDRRGRDQDG